METHTARFIYHEHVIRMSGIARLGTPRALR